MSADPTPRAAAPIRVLIADDQKVVRDGLAMLLGLLEGIEVVGTAIDGADAVRQASGPDPDVVLMDLQHADGRRRRGHRRRLTERGARARVVVLTTYADDDWVFRALHAGARGFLTKDAGAEEIRHGHHHCRRRPGPARPVGAAPVAGRAGRRRQARVARPVGRSPDDGLTAARGRGARGDRAGPVQRRDRRAGCSSPRRRSRPTSTTCWPRPGAATAPHWWLRLPHRTCRLSSAVFRHRWSG